ncbi:MAG TPA: DGQHR domain-containing protein [Verrucomicrobiae bacterium]|nr:DGQHR domain-containing protein [Verrucomicrobiae bacterium]
MVAEQGVSCQLMTEEEVVSNEETAELLEKISSCAAEAAGVLPQVIVTRQREITLYTFTLTAVQMMQLCRVERFGESDNGVNRKFHSNHAWRIAEAMLQPSTTFATNPVGALIGNWQFEDGRLTYGPGDYITLDDGQHRRAALEILNETERERWEFIVTVTQGVPYSTRLRLFLQQTKGRSVDARLKLAMQAEIGDWNSEAEKLAYQLCRELNTDPRSPLKGMILMSETEVRPYESKHRPSGINVKGLHTTFTSMLSKRSPLSQLSSEKRLEVIKNVVRAANAVWPTSWASSKHVLTTAKGINAVCKLIVVGRSFRAAVGSDFSYENLVRVLTYAQSFNWTAKRAIHETERAMTERLDTAIYRGQERATQAMQNISVE